MFSFAFCIFYIIFLPIPVSSVTFWSIVHFVLSNTKLFCPDVPWYGLVFLSNLVYNKVYRYGIVNRRMYIYAKIFCSLHKNRWFCKIMQHKQTYTDPLRWNRSLFPGVYRWKRLSLLQWKSVWHILYDHLSQRNRYALKRNQTIHWP